MDQGVTIGLREIYDKTQEVALGVQRLGDRIAVIEEKIKEADETDERSRAALEKAESAMKKVESIEKALSKINVSIIVALITGAIGMLFYFAQH